jgi:multidrug efflux pump subunit AcrB
MVVKTIEDELKSISEINTVYSTILNGRFNIMADIKTGNDSQKVLGDVKDIVSNVKRDLPSDMDEPVAKVLLHNYPLMLVAISGDVDTRRLIEVAEDLKSKLSLINELNEIAIRGKSDEEILITLDQKR